MTNDEADLMRWRRQKDESLTGPTGWLALAGLWWLSEGANTIGSDPTGDIALPAGAPTHLGVLLVRDGQASLRVTCPEEVRVDGKAVQEARLLADRDEGGPSRLTVGPLTIVIIRRGEQAAVRVWDADHPARLAFSGRRWFPPTDAFRLMGVFHQHQPPRTAPVPNTIGMVVAMENPGWVEFSLADRSLRLEALDGGPGLLWFIFRDLTSGVETYGACRYLYAPLLADGRVELDFNRAYSPPCAFTPYATCPLPPAGNSLEVRIEAGERFEP
jgi:hypothetical protein